MQLVRLPPCLTQGYAGGMSRRSSFWLSAVLAASMLMPALDTSIANAALPALAAAFEASFPQVQWIVLSYLLAITALIVGAGRLGDLFGRRRMLLAGIGVFTAASTLCGLAPTLPVLFAARAAQGLGAAVMMALSVALAADTTAKTRTGRVMGALGTVSAMGTALGPALGGVLTSACGWRAIFLVNVPVGVLALGLASRHLPPDRMTTGGRGRFDVPGTLALAGSLAAYALAMTLGHGRFGALNGTLLLAGGAGLALFVAIEARSTAPLVRVRMLLERGLFTRLGTSGVVSTVMMATLVVGPFYLAGALRLEAEMLGLALAVGPSVAALGGVPAGRMVDRFGASLTASLGLAGIAAGASLLAALPVAAGVPGYIAPIGVMTAGYALFQAANNTAIMTIAGAAERGVIAGALSLSRNLGLVTGASAMAAIFAFAAGAGAGSPAAASADAIATGMRVTFAVAALLALLGLSAQVAIRPRS
jgi:MFS family permease